MTPPRTGKEVLELVRKSGFSDKATVDRFLRRSGPLPMHPRAAVSELLEAGILTESQAEMILSGKPTGFRVGKYTLIDRLGYAAGELFHALHNLMKRRVTLQMLPPELRSPDEPLPRTYIERSYPPPMAAAALEHPNIVRPYDIDQDETRQWVVMEPLDGKQLPSLLEQAGRLPIGEACGCAVQVATGLQYFHAGWELSHGCITPTNLFVCTTGVVKILNFWGGRSYDLLNPALDPVYAAPEQLTDSTVDERCDCYSLGAVLFRMICGRIPFESEAEFAKGIVAKPTPADGVPPALVSVIMRMMAPRADERYQSITDVIEALRPFVEPATTGDYPEMAAAALACNAASG